MFSFSVRLGKRVAVLVPGIIIAYISARDIFPLLQAHVPLWLAVFITYLLAAYVLIPALIRLARIVFPPKHLPLYCVTPDGFASDPINVGLIGTRQQVIDAMTKAGWHQAEPHSLKNTIREALSVIYGWSYPNAPMSHLYFLGRMQDLGFEIPIEGGAAGSRHHVRFWATTFEGDKQLSARSIHWHSRQAQVHQDTLLWVGAASRDVGIGYIRHNAQITHMIDPDTDSERDLIIQNLCGNKLADRAETVKLGDPYRLTNRVWRGYLQTDGRMQVLKLTN